VHDLPPHPPPDGFHARGRFRASGLPAAEAARQAGYSAAYANRQAAQLLDNPRVAAYLRGLNEQIAAPGIAAAVERQEWWSEVMRDDDQDIGTRLKASELLGKAQGDFVIKAELTGANGNPVEVRQRWVLGNREIVF
jgi:phage terminase small subunit